MQNKFLLGLIGCLALVGCDAPNTGADGYTFGEPQYEKSRVVVNVETYQTRAAFEKAFEARNMPIPADDVMAFTELYPMNDYNNCVIHMIAPSVDYQPEWIGHEFTHCVYGQWHTNNDERS